MNELELMRTLRSWSVFAVLGTLLFACHDDSPSSSLGAAGDSSVAPTSGGSNGAAGGAANNVSAGGRASSGSSSSGVARGGATTPSTAAGPEKTGQVIAISSHQPSIGPGLSVMFRERSAAKCPSPQVFGDCTFYPNCEDGVTVTYVSAGSVTLTATQPAVSATSDPGSDNEYRIGSGSMQPGFSGGETAHIAASGAVIPAFATDISIPLTLLIDSPAPDANGLITASVSRDLVLKFSRGSAGVDLFLQSSGGDGSVTCQAKSESGSVTIPKEALAIIGGTHAQLWTFGNKTIAAGDWSIIVGSLMEAYTPDKSHYVTLTAQ